MSQIPKQLVENYAKALDVLSSAAKEKLRIAISNIDFSDVAKSREQVVDVMNLLLGPFISMSATVAADFYETLRELAEEKRTFHTLLHDDYEPEATEKSVRYFIQDIVDGNEAAEEDKANASTTKAAAIASFSKKLEDRIDYELKQAAGNTILENVRNDPAKPRFARVPAGNDTCEFCIMLASQGFVYYTAETAGKHRHYHPNCRCQIVPGFNGFTSVQGYDPDTYYQQWQDNEAARKEKGLETISEKGARLRAERKQGK